MDATLTASQLLFDFLQAPKVAQEDYGITGRGDNGRRPDPSESEIAEMCERIRAGWSDEELRLRQGFSDIRRDRLYA